MGSILKIISDIPCDIYCDYESKGEALANTIFRLELRKGSYLLEFVSKKNDRIRITQEYLMQSNDEECLLNISFEKILKEHEREEEFERIANLKVEILYNGECYYLKNINNENDFVINYLETDDYPHFDKNGLLSVNIGGTVDDTWYSRHIVGGKFGCLNKMGQFQIPVIYDGEINFKNKNVTVALLGEKKLFINKFGEIAFDNVYDEVANFIADYCVVGKSGKFGVIDSLGNLKIPLQYNSIKLIFNDKSILSIWANLNEKWGILDICNNVLEAFVFDEICINSTTISIRKNNLWGVCDLTGEIIIPIVYEFVYGATDGKLTLVKRNGKFGVLNYALKYFYIRWNKKENTEIIPCQYESIYNYNGGIREDFVNFISSYFIKENDDKTITCHRYDENGNLIRGFICEEFRNEIVRNNEKWGTIKGNGEIIIPCEYDEILNLWGDRSYVKIGYTVRKDKLWGIISTNGVVFANCLYDKIVKVDYYNEEYQLLFAIVIVNNKYQMLRQDPKCLSLFPEKGEYDMINYLYGDNIYAGGFFKVKLGSKWAIADLLTCKLVSSFDYNFVFYYDEKHAEVMQVIDNRRLYGLFSLEDCLESVECKYVEPHDERYSNWLVVYDKNLKKEGIIDETRIVKPFIYDYIRIYSGRKSEFFVIGKEVEYDANGGYNKGKFAIANMKMELLTEYIWSRIGGGSGDRNYISLALFNTGYTYINLKDESIQFQVPLFNYRDDIQNSDDSMTSIYVNAFKNLTLFIDVETTGLPINNNDSFENLNNWPYIVQIGFILYDDNFGKLSERGIILKPEGYKIPYESTEIHLISHNYAFSNGENRAEVLSFMDEILNNVDIVVGHNVEFDLNILKCEIIRIKGKDKVLFRKKEPKIIDTMKIGVDICRIWSGNYGEKYKWPTLDQLYTKLFNKSFIGQHNAKNDVKATYECYFEIINNRNKNKPLVEDYDLPF